MRVVFLGTPQLAVPPLKSLLDHSYDIRGVFTQPDRPSGRGHKTKPGPVKIFAEAQGIPVFQPEKIRSEENREIMNSLSPDFLVVAAYGQILPVWLLQAARLAPLNVHFSLLPHYRGAAPVAHAILNGDSITGITIMIMQQALDSGPILMQREIPISSTATAGELESELSQLGAGLLIETMDKYLKDAVRPIPQDEKKATWAHRLSRDITRIVWNENALQIHNRIRAMNPWPGAHTICRGERLHLWRSNPETGNHEFGGVPGTFLGVSPKGLRVQCGEGSVLEILEIQKPSKRRVTGREFASGARPHPNERLFHNFGYSAS
jgi:methionyl-tRNA formyltransferase